MVLFIPKIAYRSATYWYNLTIIKPFRMCVAITGQMNVVPRPHPNKMRHNVVMTGREDSPSASVAGQAHSTSFYSQ